MRRTNTQSIGDLLKEFLSENPYLDTKLAETRLINAWGEVLGQIAMRYTTNIYVRNKTLHVHISSSVLRGELMMCREKLIQTLNEKAGMYVIGDIILLG
ncbi:MAG: DUF721 domain-containing protein [Dysgonamonadaceae bacterium]|jgi:hypothetical protein|nr:DUF721 domain-containing protein [Dysgonamonadaceae bacterium]